MLSTLRHFRLTHTLPTGRFRFENLDAVKAVTSEFLPNPQRQSPQPSFRLLFLAQSGHNGYLTNGYMDAIAQTARTTPADVTQIARNDKKLFKSNEPASHCIE
jgi:NADH:ubiquinone oxidoreductase subunit E